jgi:lysozyme family protein
MANFSNYIETVLANEGGYSQSTADSGNYLNGVLIGTNMGITPAAYLAYYGQAPTKAQMQALTKPQAAAIYKRDYWDKMGGDSFPDAPITGAVFDFYVNSPRGAAVVLQTLLNAVGLTVQVDGQIGPQTRQALSHATAAGANLFNDYNRGRLEFYAWRSGKPTAPNWQAMFQQQGIAQGTSAANYSGWVNRVNKSFPVVQQLPQGSPGTRDLAAGNSRAKLANYQRIGLQVAGVALIAALVVTGFSYLVRRSRKAAIA